MPNDSDAYQKTVEQFITRWQGAEASERANYQMFLTELCAPFTPSEVRTPEVAKRPTKPSRRNPRPTPHHRPRSL
jgi:hypothetical protein